MIEYEVRIEKSPCEKIEMTVIATDICHALDLVDVYLKRNMVDFEDWEVVDCKFIKRFPLCLIERPSGIEYL